MTLQEGDPSVIGGYRLERRLGAGGMGVVYLGRSVSGRRLAVKVIRPELVTDEGFRVRFRREVEAARQVSGAFTAPVVDAGPDAEQPWLATLFVPGPTLHQHVTSAGPLAAAAAHRLAAGLVEALRDIHRAGLVHRDLKPGNVLLADDGPRVIDFGIARAVAAAPLTTTGVAIGTPGYMAPEQLRTGGTGPEADVFALGSVLVFATTGHGPFDGMSSDGIGYRVVHEDPDLTGLPGTLRPLVTACLAKEPGGRPTVEELLAALSAPTGEPPAVPTPSSAGPVPAEPSSAGPVPAPVPAAADTPTRRDVPTSRDAAPTRPDTPPVPVPAPVPPAPRLVPGAALPGARPPKRKRTAVVVSATVLALAAAVTVPLVVLHDRGGGHASADSPGKGAASQQPKTPAAPSSSSSTSAAPFSCAGAQGRVRADGSNLVGPLMNRWTTRFQARCPGATVVYTGTGPDAGLTSFLSGQADFAVDDAPLDQQGLDRSRARCQSRGGGQAVDLPLAATQIAVVYNLPGVRDLVLDAATLAKIFDGRITRWNDAAIGRLNPGATLPSTAVRAVHRADYSSSTLALTTYLHTAAVSAWPHTPDGSWPGKGGVGSTGAIAQEHEVGTVAGSIGYSVAGSADPLATARIATGAGDPVAVGPATATAFVAHAAASGGPGGDLVLTPDYGGTAPGAYPLTAVSYAVVCAKGNAAGTLTTLRAFLAYATGAPGAQDAAAVGFGPLPDALASRVHKAIAALD
ncbi:serine/threonine-protein kinase [Streptomyces sp. NRRL F-5123]|uniref:serine/threonine-protein kinase n=1 Tax=Streptomyces sp. NRRL F-5123 TaxID=1463856 RepID=UPI00069458DB|nr:serine/threonine-protein kinase [Streptomyces sp. NRRL F-5123]